MERTAHPNETGPQGRIRLLARTPLFNLLPEATLAALAVNAKERRMEPDEVLLRRGDPSNSMFVILAGEVQISLRGTAGRDQVLAILRPGDVFGEVGLLDGRARTADAISLVNGKLFTLERKHLIAQLQIADRQRFDATHDWSRMR